MARFRRAEIGTFESHWGSRPMTSVYHEREERSAMRDMFGETRRSRSRRFTSVARAITLGVLVVNVGTACSVSDLVNAKRPSNILDPDAVKTYDGAIMMYGGVLTLFGASFNGTTSPYNLMSGLLTDEYRLNVFDRVDVRNDFELVTSPQSSQQTSSTFAYSSLQTVRINASQTIGLLQTYAKEAPPAFTARMYIVRGYVELFLAEAYCAGVPLTEVPYSGDLQYGQPLTTGALTAHAAAQFDSAMLYATDSLRVMDAAKIGKARALMDLKQYSDAAALVSGIPTNYVYGVAYSSSVAAGKDYFQNSASSIGHFVPNREGGNGLDYVTAHDPRVPLDSIGRANSGEPFMVPHSFARPTHTVALASGVEARLIEAEVLLSQDRIPEWSAALNDLRTGGTFSTAPGSTPGTIDTTWNAGSGGVAGLKPLQDPGSANQQRVLLTFREKAFWLFGTGHRQGDLRRLVRQYQIRPDQLYPVGAYYQSGVRYGTDVNVAIPPKERDGNPYFHGCLNREP